MLKRTLLCLLALCIWNIESEAANWYSQGTGNANNPTTWKANPDGSGATASVGDFAVSGNTWFVQTALSLSATWTIANNSNIEITGTGSLSAGTQTINLGGNWLNNGTFNAGAGTVVFNATSTGRTLAGAMTGTNAFNNITFSSGTGSWSFGANSADVNGIFTITNTAAGGVTAPSTTLKLMSNLVYTAGTFNHNNGTIQLVGTTSQNLAGLSYYNLSNLNTTATVNATGNVTVVNSFSTVAGSTFSLGTNTLAGAFTASNLGTLVTSNTSGAPVSTGKTWGGTLLFNNNTGAMTIPTGTYNNVIISGTTGNRTIQSGVVMNGNFSLTTTSGLTTLGGALTVGGNISITGTTSASRFDVSTSNHQITLGGNWTQSSTGATNIFNQRAGSVVLNGSGTQTITVGGGTAVPTFYNLQVTNTSQPVSLNSVYTVGNDLTIAAGATCSVGTATFTVTGSVVNNGTLNLGANTLNVGGNWTNNGTFNSGTGTVVFNSSATGRTIGGNLTGTNRFNNIEFNSFAGGWSFTSTNVDVSGNFMISAASNSPNGVGGPSGTLKVGGNFRRFNGAYRHNNGTIELNGTVKQTIAGPLADGWNNVVVNNATDTVVLGAQLTVNGDFTINAGSKFSCANLALVPRGNYTNNGSFIAGTGTVRFQAATTGRTISGNMTGANKFHNLQFNSATGGWSFGADSVEVINAFDVIAASASGVTLPSTFVKIAGGMSAPVGTIAHNNGTVILNGTTTQQLPANPVTFYNLSIANTTSTVNANAALTVNGTLTIASGANFNMRTNQLTGAFTPSVSGTLQTQNGTALPIPSGRTWGGTVLYNGAAVNMSVVTGTYNNLTITGTTGTRSTTGTVTVNQDLAITTTSGITTLGGQLNVLRNISITGTTTASIFDVSASNYQIDLGGNWTQSSSTTTQVFAPRAGLVRIMGTSTQTISVAAGTSVPTFFNFRNSNTSQPVTLGSGIGINGTFTNDAGATATVGTATLSVGGNVSNAGTLNAGANTINVGGNWANTGTFNAGTGTVVFNSAAIGRTITGNLTGTNKFNNLRFNNAAGGWSFAGNSADVGGNLTITAASSLTLPSTTLKVAGNIVYTAGTVVPNGGTVEMNGTLAQTLPGAALTLNILSLNNTAAAVTLNANLTLTGNLSIPANNTLSCGATTLTLGGNYANSGTFTAGTGTVLFNAATTGRTLTGKMTGTSRFNNLTFNNAAGAWSFGADSAEVAGNFIITAANTASNGVRLPSTNIKVAGNYAAATTTMTHNSGTVILNGTTAQTVTNGTAAFNNLSVINTTNTVNATAATTVSGTLTIASGANLNMQTNQLTGATLTPSVSGTLQTQNTANPPIPINKTWGGTVLYNAATTGMFVSAGVYNNLNIVGTTGARATTGTVTVNQNLAVTSTSGRTTLGGNLTVNGNLSINGTTTSGILDVSTSNYQITIGGNWAQGATTTTQPFNQRAGTVVFNGTGAQSISVSSGTALPTFNNLSNNKPSGALSLASAIVIAGNFTNSVTATFTTNNRNITVGGNWANNGTFNAGTGTVTFNATTTGRTISGSLTGTNKFNNVTFNSGTGAWSFGSNAADIGGNLTITNTAAGTGVTAPSTTLKVAGNFSRTGGVFTHNSGTVELNGTGAQSVPGTAATVFNTLNLNNTGGVISSNGTITVNNAFTIPANNSFTSGAAQILILGNSYTNNGTFTASTGTVSFTSATTGRTLSGKMTGANKFNNLTFNNASGAWSFGADSADVGGIFTLSNGTATLPSTTLKIAGNFVRGGGTINANGGTVVMNGTAAQSIGASMTLNNLSITNTAGIVAATAVITVNGNLSTLPTSTLNMATSALQGSVNGSGHTGLLTTQSTVTPPIPTGRTWGGTVAYNSTTTAMIVAQGIYNNLRVTGTSGTRMFTAGATTVNGTFSVTSTGTGWVTLGGNLTVGGNIIITGGTTANILDVTTNNYQISVGGNWSQSSPTAVIPFNRRSGTVVFNGIGTQTIQTTGGTSRPTFYNLTIANTVNPVSVSTNTDVSNILSVSGSATVSPTTEGIVFNTAAAAGTITGSGTIRVNRISATPEYSSQYRFTANQLNNMTVDYCGAGNQTINHNTYGTIITSNSGIKTVAGGDVTINNGLLVNSGTIMDLASSFRLIGSLPTYTVSGTLRTAVPTATSTLPIPSGATWAGSGTIAYTATTGAQTIVSGTFNNLTLSNTSGTNAVGGTLTVNGIFTLGKATLGSFNLNMGTAASFTGAGSSNYLIATGTGRILRSIAANGTLDFPVGDVTNYTPLSLNVSGTAYSAAVVNVGLATAKHPNNVNAGNYLNRYWSVSHSGITDPSYNANATFVPADVTGLSANVSSAVYTGSLPWLRFASVSGNTIAANGITATNAAVTGISSFNPTVNVTPSNITICNNGTTPLTANGTGDGTLSYSWTPSTGLSATTGTTVSATGVNNGTVTATNIYTVQVTDGNGMTSTNTATVNILPQENITGNFETCEGFSTTLSGQSPGGTWSSSNGNVTVGSSSGVVTGVTAGTSTITYTYGIGCISTAVVTVYTVPVINASGGVAVCAGTPSVLTATGGISYTWAPPATLSATTGASVVATPTVTTTYTVSGSNGVCAATAEVTVTINPLPDAGTIVGPTNVTSGSTASFTNASAGGVWSSSNTGVATIGSASGSLFGVTPGTSIITYTASNLCGSSSTTANVIIDPAFTTPVTGTFTVCSGTTSALANATPGGVWASSNNAVGTIAPSGVFTGLTAGTTRISYTLLGTTESAVVTVNTTPAISGLPGACVGITNTLTATVPGGNWTSSNPARATINATTGVISGVLTGTTVTITYTTPAGCSAASVTTVNSVSGTAITGINVICAGAITAFAHPLAGTWSSSNTGIATVPATPGTITGVAAGNTLITFRPTATGCYLTRPITVNPSPAAIVGTGVLCIGSSTTFTNPSAGGTWSQTSVPTSALTINTISGLSTGFAAGTARISYTVAGCSATRVITVSANPGVIGGTATVCTGSTTTLTATPAGGLWTSSNGAIATVTSGIVTGVANGTAVITYSAGSGCFTTRIVTVSAPPAAGTTGTICVGSPFTLTTTSVGTWSSSNTAIARVASTSGLVTGVAIGTATITFRSSPTCFATGIFTVTPAPPTITGLNRVCINSTISLSHTSPGGTWSSSFPSRASVDASGVVLGLSTGTPVITYTTPGGCIVTSVITVNPMPTTINGSAVVCEGATTTLSNVTPGGTWSGSDARATIGSLSGVVPGISSGTTRVTYTVSSTGCRTTAVVTVNTTPGTITGNAPLCVGNTTTLSVTPAGGTWLSSNGSAAPIGITSGVITGSSIGGTATITYTLPTGCRRTTTINILPLPGTLTGGAVPFCSGNVTNITASISGLTWSSTNTVVATVATLTPTSGRVTGISAGTTTISYTNANGCAVSRVVTVTVVPAAITGSSTVPVGVTTPFANSIPGGNWTSSNPSIGSINIASGLFTGIAPGTTVITYTTSGSCFVTRVVTVSAVITPHISGPTSVCIGVGGSFTAATAGGTWTSSNPYIASIDLNTGFAMGVSPGTVTLTYSASPGTYVTRQLTVSMYVFPVSGTYTVCAGGATALSTADPGGIWSATNPAVGTINPITGVYVGISQGTSSITYTNPITTCYSTKVVTVHAMPSAISGPASVCKGAEITLTNAMAGGTWYSYADIVGTINPVSGVFTGIDPDTMSVAYSSPEGCFVFRQITVNPIPETITGSNILGTITNTTATLSSSTTGGEWTSSDGGVATIGLASGVVTSVGVGTTNITYTIPATGCFRTRVQTVVAGRPMAGTATGTDAAGTIRIFPTPTTGMLTIEAPVSGTFKVMNIDGRIVAQYPINTGSTTINLPADLAAGVYMCRFEGVDGVVETAMVVLKW
jgi:hypothetical protein